MTWIEGSHGLPVTMCEREELERFRFFGPLTGILPLLPPSRPGVVSDRLTRSVQ
jgi:hypothetical protein